MVMCLIRQKNIVKIGKLIKHFIGKYKPFLKLHSFNFRVAACMDAVYPARAISTLYFFLCNMHVLLRNLAYYKSCVCYCVVFAIELLRNGLTD